MSNKQERIKFLDARALPVRIGLAVAILLALVFGWFAVRWQIGNMLAQLTNTTDPNANEIAAFAVRLAPSDPLTSWLSAGTKREIFAPDSEVATIDGYKDVVKLSPNDFRWWVELGRAYEQADNADEAEKAYLQAISLAPTYTYPHWQLGNFYLRQNRSDDGFNELKKAAETNPIYRDQVFSLAWDYYDKNTEKLEQIAGNTPSVRAGLARFYASKERADDALRIWNTLSPEEKQENVNYANTIALAFYEKRIFPQAQEFYRGLGIEPDAKPETIQNAGFEKPIGDINSTYFGWRVQPGEKISVKLDPSQKHEGSRSLRVSFGGYTAATLYNITQIVVVKPATKYRLTFWLRTEDLKSGGTPKLEVNNGSDSIGIVATPQFPAGTNDWQQLKLEFTTPANENSIAIRTAREFCGDKCPIFGTIWYDDFRLEAVK